MALCTPTLVGPISELSSSVVVIGALPGATVTVESIGPNPRMIGRHTCSGGRDRVRFGFQLINPEFPLVDDLLVVKQELNGETSERTPDAMALPVLEVPTEVARIGHVGLASHLYVCGKRIWVTGALPGATVVVEFGGAEQGEAVAANGEARIKLAQPLPSSPVAVFQRLRVGDGPRLTVTPDLYAPPGSELPAPVLGDDAYECQTAIVVDQVIDGATVTIQGTVGGDPSYKSSVDFDLTSLWMNVKPLKIGDRFTLSQNLDQQCEHRSKQSAEFRVKALTDLRTPTVQGPICKGARHVVLSDLVSGALVTINANGKQYKGMLPPDAGSNFTFWVEPINGGQVTAQQTLCGHTSVASSPVDVVPLPNAVTAKISPRVFACARAIDVAAEPGSILQVWKKDGVTDRQGVISGLVVAGVWPNGAKLTTVPLSVLPQAKDSLWVRQLVCSGVNNSDKVKVENHPPIVAPKVEAPYTTAQTVIVYCIPGALIELYRSDLQGAWRYESQAFGEPDTQGGGYAICPVRSKLTLETRLRAVQTLCSQRSGPGPEVQPKIPPPERPVITNPADGGTVSTATPTITWSDPGMGTDAQATSFRVVVKENSNPFPVVFSTTVTSTSATITTPLRNGISYTVEVTSTNSSGSTTSIYHLFQVSLSTTTQVVFYAQLDPRQILSRTAARKTFEKIELASFIVQDERGRQKRIDLSNSGLRKDYIESRINVAPGELSFGPSALWQVIEVEFRVMIQDSNGSTDTSYPNTVAPNVGSPITMLSAGRFGVLVGQKETGGGVSVETTWRTANS
jgi:hypothetical protein